MSLFFCFSTVFSRINYKWTELIAIDLMKIHCWLMTHKLNYTACTSHFLYLNDQPPPTCLCGEAAQHFYYPPPIPTIIESIQIFSTYCAIFCFSIFQNLGYFCSTKHFRIINLFHWIKIKTEIILLLWHKHFPHTLSTTLFTITKLYLEKSETGSSNMDFQKK